MALKKILDPTGIPLQGGVNTRTHKALLDMGSFSDMQNVRGSHPGFRKRPGQKKLHSTADSTNEVLSLYQFRKEKISETHFFAQMSDGDILEATNAPPTVTTGAFGSEVYSGSSGQLPASWSSLDDILICSNGVDQHQTYTGDDNYVLSFVKYTETSAPSNMPEEGFDYSTEVSDGLTTTSAVLDSLNAYATNPHCIFIRSPVPATKLTWTISLPNGTASVGTLYYRKSDNTWANTSMTDGTISSGATLGKSGSMTWTAPSDEIPHYMYGYSGFWYQLRVSVTLDSEVEVTKVTYGSGFQDMRNVWDGRYKAAIEAQFYDITDGTYSIYSATSVVVSSMEKESGANSDDKDRVYFSTTDPIQAIYIDVGSAPNENTSAVVYGIKGWTGSSFTTVGTISDGTNGLTSSGWITFPRLAVEPTQFNSTGYYAYWYYFWIGTDDFSEPMSISIYTMPYFDIEELGRSGASIIWKGRGIYSFTKYPHWLYVSRYGVHNALNGDDYGVLEAGDGRANKVIAIRKFHNEIMVFQEEKGSEGGCVTLFQGYSPDTFGKLLISSQIGTMSNKTVVVVDGVMTSTKTEDKVQTLVFFLSRYGVCVSDGTSITIISDDIQNYFDPTESECIRKGYEDKMWMAYDPAFNVIRIGLVSGSSATLPNVFPVFDLTDKTWSFDKLGQELSCISNIEAGSGNIITLQVGGGIDDGTVYQLNTTTNDVSTAIDSYLIMELNYLGYVLTLIEMMIRAEAVAASAGDITVTFYENSIANGSKTLSMSPEITSQTVRRHKYTLNLTSQNISVKIQNNAASKEMNLLDVGFKILYQEGV